jgi:hypothetical protein
MLEVGRRIDRIGWKLTDIGFLAFQDIGNLLLDGKRDIGWFASVILSINFRYKDREGG